MVVAVPPEGSSTTVSSPSSGHGKAGLLGWMAPEVFAHFELHPVQFGQVAAGREAVVVGVGLGFAELLDLPLESLDALERAARYACSFWIMVR